MEIDVGQFITKAIVQVQEDEAIRQSKEIAENRASFEELSLLIGDFARQMGNRFKPASKSKIDQLQEQIKSIRKSGSTDLISGNQTKRDKLVDQIYSKLSVFNQIGMSEELIKERISKLIQLQISITSK